MISIIVLLTTLTTIVFGYFKSSYSYKLNNEKNNKKHDLFNDDYKVNTGIDMRHPNTSVADNESLRILSDNLERLVLLNKLNNQNKTNIEKIQLIESSYVLNMNSSYVTTIHAGGLMDDFNNMF